MGDRDASFDGLLDSSLLLVEGKGLYEGVEEIGDLTEAGAEHTGDPFAAFFGVHILDYGGKVASAGAAMALIEE